MIVTSLPENTSSPEFDQLFYQAVREIEFDQTKLNNVVVRVTQRALTMVSLGKGTVSDDLQFQLHRFSEALHTVGMIRQALTQAHAAKAGSDSHRTSLSLANAHRHVSEAFSQLDAVEQKLRQLLVEGREQPAVQTVG